MLLFEFGVVTMANCLWCDTSVNCSRETQCKQGCSLRNPAALAVLFPSLSLYFWCQIHLTETVYALEIHSLKCLTKCIPVKLRIIMCQIARPNHVSNIVLFDKLIVVLMQTITLYQWQRLAFHQPLWCDTIWNELNNWNKINESSIFVWCLSRRDFSLLWLLPLASKQENWHFKLFPFFLCWIRKLRFPWNFKKVVSHHFFCVLCTTTYPHIVCL